MSYAKKISLTCCCGAKCEMIDETGSYINSDGKADAKGRQFLIEVRADEWLDRHESCRNANVRKEIIQA